MAPASLDMPLTVRSRSNRIRRYQVDRVRKLRHLAGGAARTRLDQDMTRIIRAWEELAAHRPRVAATLELHYFGRFEVSGVALTLGRSLETSALDLRFGYAVLESALRRHR